MATKTKLPKDYQNNPFFIATNGIAKLFNLARGIAIIFVVLSVVIYFANGSTPAEDTTKTPEEFATSVQSSIESITTNEWVTIIGSVVIIGAALILLAALFGGVSAYTAARLAKDQPVTVNEAFKVAFEHLWSFLWLQIIIGVKTFLWTLLFIIPGIIMSVRYSLAGIAFFDKDLRGNAAVKESLRLTKGAWITTFSGVALLNYITLGVISLIINIGANATLYKQFSQIKGDKPAAHWLSWVTLFLPFALLALLLVFIVSVLGIIAATGGKFSE